MKTLDISRENWAQKLLAVVWAYNTTWKTITGFTPYELVYGKKPILLIKFEIQTLKTTFEVGIELTEEK